MGKPKSVGNSRRDKFGRSALLSSFFSNFAKVFYCTALKLPPPSFRCLKCKDYVFSTCGCCTGYQILILISPNSSYSLWPTTMEVLVKEENICFCRDLPTFTSLIQALFYKTYSTASLLCPQKTIIPEGKTKNVFSPCTLPSGTELLSFRDALPDIATHKAPAFHLVL